jgi:hypothetical protein
LSDHSFHQDEAADRGRVPALSPFHGRQIRGVRKSRPALNGTDLYGAHAPAHEDPAIDYRKHLAILVKHGWLIAGITAIALALGLFYTLLQTPTYRASATIQIKREAANISGIAGLESVEAGRGDEFYQTQYELLKSRAVAELVVSSRSPDQGGSRPHPRLAESELRSLGERGAGVVAQDGRTQIGGDGLSEPQYPLHHPAARSGYQPVAL